MDGQSKAHAAEMRAEEPPPVRISLVIPRAAAMRLGIFAAEAGVPKEEVVRFALAQFLAWQDGVASLILHGQDNQEEG